MAASGTVKKIIWALDAFDTANDIQAHVIEALKNLVNDRPVSIEPLYVLSPDQLDVSVDFTPPWIEHYKPAAQKALEIRIKGLDSAGVTQPRVLVQKRSSLRDSVRALISHAKGAGADLIVVGSHGRKGLPRLILGSFTETLVLLSKIPVLVVGPSSRISQGFNHIMFPTDFSDRAYPVFLRVVRLAKELNAKVTMLHAIPNPIEPVFQTGVYLLGGGWVPVPAFMDSVEAKQRGIAKRWMERVAKHGVSIELVIDQSAHGIMESILDHAKERKADLIAMASQSGALTSTLIGSIGRQVVRTAPCPVWVMRASDVT